MYSLQKRIKSQKEKLTEKKGRTDDLGWKEIESNIRNSAIAKNITGTKTDNSSFRSLVSY